MPAKITSRGFQPIYVTPIPPRLTRKRCQKTKTDPSDYIPESRDKFHDPVRSDRQQGESVAER